ncbi:hypothetical protein A9Q87_04755 [Flavobacteriales bacterium 34_180_T64]|nr:hypothetical protein A9Q87_04755 [Flavobacteriales bacterium 34_180_T64]
MNEKALMIATGFPNMEEQEALKFYTENVGKLLMESEGIPVSRYSLNEHLFGEQKIANIFVAEFPNKETIKEFFESAEYKALLPYRNKAFVSINIYIAN